MYRVLSLSLVAVALALFVGGPARADDQNKADQGHAHTGKFVNAEGNQFMMTSKDGKEHSHTLAADAKVTCDGKVCRLSDLKKGTLIRVWTNPNHKDIATKVEATTRDRFEDRPGNDLNRR